MIREVKDHNALFADAQERYLQTRDKKVLADLGLDPNKKTVVIFMGSLGSSSVSEIVDKSCSNFKDFQVLIVTGKANDYTFNVWQRTVSPWKESKSVVIENT